MEVLLYYIDNIENKDREEESGAMVQEKNAKRESGILQGDEQKLLDRLCAGNNYRDNACTYDFDVDLLSDDLKNELEEYCQKDIDNISDQEIFNFIKE